MCGGVQYPYQGKTIKIYFPDPNARLPILMKDQSIEFMPWGRRREQAGHLPQGGWARHESVLNGVWDKYQPVPVKIQVDAFMEKDQNKVSHWFNLEQGQFIQGVLANRGDEHRVYVVTVTPPMDNPIHDRWPRIIGLQHGQ
jgi:hypothetical protein